MKRPTFTDQFTILLPLDQAFILCINHMNYISSHKLITFSPKDSREQGFVEHLRMPWSPVVEKINFKLVATSASETDVSVTGVASLPISSYKFPAIKKVLHYLKQTTHFNVTECAKVVLGKLDR